MEKDNENETVQTESYTLLSSEVANAALYIIHVSLGRQYHSPSWTNWINARNARTLRECATNFVICLYHYLASLLHQPGTVILFAMKTVFDQFK